MKSKWGIFAAAAILSLTAPLAASAANHKQKCVPAIPTSGDVLIAGGRGGPFELQSSNANAEFFDPSSGSFKSLCTMTAQRVDAAVLLPTTGKYKGHVLILGGYLKDKSGDGVDRVVKNGDDLNPEIGKFKKTRTMNPGVNGPGAQMFPNGTALIAGGRISYSGEAEIEKTAQTFDPSSGAFRKISALMTSPRAYFGAALLSCGGCANDGKVLLAGGYTGTSMAVSSAELYDPVAQTFTATSPMNAARSYFTITTLNDGTVLITGGYDAEQKSLQSAEFYDPTTGTWTPTTGQMNEKRGNHTATLLPDGTVLIAGGDSSYAGAVSDTAELYDPTKGTFAYTTNPMNYARTRQSATLLGSGKVLIAGGQTQDTVLQSAELYDPSSQAFTPTGDMLFPHSEHSAALIP